jgi:hypothetical protein
LRTLHEAGPELKRAISGNLEELLNDDPEPMHRVSYYKYFSPSSSINTFSMLFFREIIRCLEACGHQCGGSKYPERLQYKKMPCKITKYKVNF